MDSEGNVVPGVKAVSIYTFIGTGQHTEEMLDSLRKQAEKLGKFYQKMHFSKWDGEAYDLGEDRALFIAPLESKKGVVVYLGD